LGRDLTIDTVTPAELTPDELAVWRGIVAADDRYASPYFDPDFTRVAGEVAPGAAVAVLHRGGDLVGFFPHQRRGEAIQPIGAPLNDYHGVIARPGAAPLLEALPALLGAPSVSVNAWVGPSSGTGMITGRTLQADLTQGWAAYDAGRRAAHRKYFKDKDRARRSFERDHGEIVVNTDSRDRAGLDRLISLKRAQYRDSGRHDIFACGWTADLLRALHAADAPGFGARIAVLEAGGEPVAYEVGLHAGDRYHFWIPAYEAHVSRYSPGILLSLETMREGAEQGFSVFDYGFEGEPYKKYFCDREETVLEGVVRREGRRDVFTGALAVSRLALSVRRRWAAIDACETTTLGRARGVASAAGSALQRARAPQVAAGVATLIVL